MEFKQTLKNRTSTRNFLSDPVDEKLLDALVTAALYAPVGMRQFKSLSLTVVTNGELLEKIRLAAVKAMGNEKANPLYGAPALIIVSSSNPPEISMANTACMVENMLLQATELGLGNVYICGCLEAVSKDADLCAALKIPAGMRPYGAVAVGYAAQPLVPREKPANDVSQIIYLR